jgi:hypothetical protein
METKHIKIFIFDPTRDLCIHVLFKVQVYLKEVHPIVKGTIEVSELPQTDNIYVLFPQHP